MLASHASRPEGPEDSKALSNRTGGPCPTMMSFDQIRRRIRLFLYRPGSGKQMREKRCTPGGRRGDEARAALRTHWLSACAYDKK